MKSPLETILDQAKRVTSIGKDAVSSVLNANIGSITGNESRNSSNFGIAVNTILGLPKATLNTGKDILQSVARTGIGFGGDVRNAVVPKAKQNFEYQPTGVAATILGKEPIQTIAARVAGNERTIKESPIAQKYNLSGNAALPIAFTGSVGAAFLDLYPGTAGKGKLVTQLVKETDEKIVRQILKNSVRNLNDVAIDQIAPVIAKSKDPKVIQKILGAVVPKQPTVARSFADFNVDDQNFFTKYAEQVKSGNGVKLKDTQIVKDTFKTYGLNVPENPKQIASQIDVMKQGLDEAIVRTATPRPDPVRVLLKDAMRVANEGKSAVKPIKNPMTGRFEGSVSTKPMTDIVPPVTPEKNILQRMGDLYKKSPFGSEKGSIGVSNIADDAGFLPKKEVAPVDRLIAEGKIRVKREGNRDVYEYKKGNNWQRARDEDSAVKGATPKPSTANLPQNLEERKIALQIQREVLDNDPMKELVKFVPKKGESKGSLPEVLGGKGSKFKQRGDDIVREILGPEADTEMARRKMDDYLKQKRSLENAEIELSNDIGAFKKSRLETKTTPTLAETVSKRLPVAEKMKAPKAELQSLENMAEQSATREFLDPQLKKSSSLINIIDKTSTPVKVKVNMLDYIRTPENVLKKLGLSKQADKIRESYDAYVQELPKNIDKITQWSKQVPKESNQRIFKFLDGQDINLNANESKVAGEIKTYLAQWADRLGLPKDNRVSSYITHLFDDQLLKKEFDEDLAKIIADKVPGSVYDPFLLKRLGAKGYKEDTWAALDAYVKRGTRKVHMDPALESLEVASRGLEESQWNYVKRYADRINLRPTELDNIVDNGIKSVIGYRLGQRPVNTITGSLRRATYRGMLGLNLGSAVRNLSQGINTYAKLGEKYTALGYAKLFSPKNLAELEARGVLTSQFVQDRSVSAVKKTMQKVDKGLFFFFETAEKINRGAAYFGAKAKGIASGMTEEQAITYAKKIVRETQFAFGSIDTPVGLSSDLVKTLTQFQSFTTKQIEFLAGMAKNKEYAGLIRYALSGIAFVYTVGQAIGMDPKDIIPAFRLGAPPSLKLPIEVASAVVDAPDEYGAPRTVGDKAGDIAATLPGYIPAGIQAKKTIQGTKSVLEGGSYDKAGKLQFPQGESKAQQLQSILFGKYASSNAQDYFEGNTISRQAKATVKPIYDRVQELKLEAGGDTEEGQALIDSLSDEEYDIYKAIKSEEQAKRTNELKKQVRPIYDKVQALKLKAGTDTEEGQALVDSLTDEEYKAYQLIKREKAKIEYAKNAEPEYDQALISRYAEAVVKDPANALKALFTKEKLGKVEGNLVELQRFYGRPFNDVGGSQEYKKKRMEAMGIPWSQAEDYKLEHIVPVSAGGDNSESNLMPINNTEHDAYTPIDIALGNAVKLKKITRSKAAELARGFKIDKKYTVEDIINSIK